MMGELKFFLGLQIKQSKEGTFVHQAKYTKDIVRTFKIVIPVFPKKTKCKPICMLGSSFMHIVTYKCIQKQYHLRKKEIIRDLCLILETKAPNSTSSRLGLRTPKTQQHLQQTPEQVPLFEQDCLARVSTCRTQQVWGKDECKSFIVD
jgi:hypothetical protein